jgi:protein gp37
MSKSGVNWMMDWGKAWGLSPENWSPYVGCTPCSPGCEHCWAERLEDTRLKHLDRCKGHPFNAGPVWQGLSTKLVPLGWKKPRLAWCCPSSDPFHPDIADPSGSAIGPRLIDTVFKMVEFSPAHHFLMLTKRAERMAEYMANRSMQGLGVLHNLSLGITVCNQSEWDEKVPRLLQTPAAMRFVSVEPMLDWISLDGRDTGGLDWVIIGCESGAERRPIDVEPMARLVGALSNRDIPVYVKQVDLGDRLSHDPEEWPEVLRVRQIPERRQA